MGRANLCSGRYAAMTALAIGLGAAAPASALTVEEFLTRAQTLKAKGMMAVFHKKEINALVEEMKGITQAYKVDHDRAAPAGDPALGCPPPPGSAASKDPKNRMTSDQFLGSLAAIPKEKRERTSVKTAFYDIMRTRYPCPAK